MFIGKKITLGITGGIASYKAADIVSWLKNQRADVQVVMTENACKFITPLTLKTLSGHPVAVDMMSEDHFWNVPHIDCAQCDLFVIVPATANILAKITYGLADDLLSSAALATKAPVLIAPAMHTDMYTNTATANNISTLRERGFHFVAPGFGRLACGAVGQGRLADVAVIKENITSLLLPRQDLAGLKVMVTAGPTREKIDPVRYISNRSSGKMGYAIAQAAQQRGAEVILISGPVCLEAPCGVQLIKIESAQEMYDVVWQHYATCDIVVKAAAVADYRPQEVFAHKLKKSAASTLELTANKDILASLGADKGHRILVGFAAETDNLQQYALNKLRDKNLDLIIANDVSMEGAGFDTDTNIITVIDVAGTMRSWPKISKKEAADIMFDCVTQLPRFLDLQKQKRGRNN
ncbi:MAG: bifunctional phosphopantothenoylcysteine decarboxylase/phosphopantothenate--cysteine ligase CoaBC [Bacillota bacterium]|jgi:phosphopantothenoylcysteine decarboxylase/phosphopantothenate--cysteine ligase